MKQNQIFRQIGMSFCCIVLCAMTLQAQHANRLTGPKAKNTKAWEKQKETTVVNLPLMVNHLQGPMRKNSNIGIASLTTHEVEPSPINSIGALSLTGPMFKNMPIYERLLYPQIDSLDTRLDSIYQSISQ